VCEFGGRGAADSRAAIWRNGVGAMLHGFAAADGGPLPLPGRIDSGRAGKTDGADRALQEEDAVHGVAVKYSEPSDKKIPAQKWRLYVFKEDKQQDVFRIHRQSAYLIGKDRRVCDIPMDHPSISKQHSVIQYRQKPTYTEDGLLDKPVVKPYIIDLGSTNGTFLNGTQVEALRYYELLEKDVLKFGFSTREYVLLHAASHLAGDDSPETLKVDPRDIPV